MNKTLTLKYVIVGEDGERRARFPVSDDAVVSTNELLSVLRARHPGKEIRIVKWSARITAPVEDLPPL